MNLEQWFFTVDNAASIWMAGMMTIQTIILVFGGFFGYKQYRFYQQSLRRGHCQKIYILNKKINKKVEFCLSRFTLGHNFNLEKDFPYVPRSLSGIARIFKIITEKYWDSSKEIDDLFSEAFDENNFLGDRDLLPLLIEKRELISEVFYNFQRGFTMLHEYGEAIIHGIETGQEEKKIKNLYAKMPRSMNDKVNHWVIRFLLIDNKLENLLLSKMHEDF
ncbi:hypothetical protein SAMN04488104_102732 [Algoriphagus faecimaris]|uniref:Uncharacterized protein n=1 Tax=Algoriphagus faecimaris TaxID=686796 RepID=A0A1G6UAA9_9BACT|nr:hypothetical protein [Algoriphagus faecimaris]SDD38308.1 hypothetical protein SAMN04488104_102732 [Algoriphagus faecimaris]